MTGFLAPIPAMPGAAPVPAAAAALSGEGSDGAFAALFAAVVLTGERGSDPAAASTADGAEAVVEGDLIEKLGEESAEGAAIMVPLPQVPSVSAIDVLSGHSGLTAESIVARTDDMTRVLVRSGSDEEQAGAAVVRPATDGMGRSILMAQLAEPVDRAPTPAAKGPPTDLEPVAPALTSSPVAVPKADSPAHRRETMAGADRLTRTADRDRIAPAMTATMTRAPDRAPERTTTVVVGQDGAFSLSDVVTPVDTFAGDAAAGGGETGLGTAMQEVRRATLEGTGPIRPTAMAVPPEQQIVAAVTTSDSGRTEIVLDPQELGRVRLSLEGDEGALVLTIQAERAETADLLRRNADLLVQEFRQAGYENLSFSFSDRGHQSDRAPAPEGDGTGGLTAAHADPVPDGTTGPRGAGSLDLRL